MNHFFINISEYKGKFNEQKEMFLQFVDTALKKSESIIQYTREKVKA